jgi:3-oxoacid CoA-transferase
LQRYTTKAFGTIMAKAAKITIVEAENIVPVGAIDPNDVHLPGIFVDRIIPATAEKHIENIKLRATEESADNSNKSASQARRERIAKRTAKELKHGSYVNLGVGKIMHPASGVMDIDTVLRNSNSCSIIPFTRDKGLDPV